jgi:pimeloyl-ACP methyl ester carboxylesterase
MLSIAHPTLFSSLVLLDPIIAPDEMIKVGLLLAKNSLHRQVEWPSREEAEKSMKKAFRTWDSRVLEKFNQYALFPPPIEGNGTSSQATRLTTGRFQELVGFVRPTFIYDGDIENENVTWVTEVFMAHKLIPYAPCNTLFICGEKSVSAGPEIRKDWLARSGTGVQGRIRRHERRVEEAVIPRRGHFVPLEAPRACAEAAARWIDEETKKWEAEEESGRRNWSMLSGKGRESRANAWMDSLKSKI